MKLKTGFQILTLLIALFLCAPSQAVIMVGFDATTTTTPSGPTPFFEDGFESGDLTNWSGSSGTTTVGTWGSLGITGPSGGGSYGVKILSASYIYKNFTGVNDIWAVFDVRTPASSTELRHVLLKGNSGAAVNQLFTFNTAGKLWLWNYASSAGHTFSHVYTANTWYKIKIHVKVHNSAGEVDVYYENAGAWVQDGTTWSGIDTDNGITNIDQIDLGTTAATATGYYDNVALYDEDPSSPPSSGVTPEFSDDFESGSLSAGWTSNYDVSVDTWANFGISGPSGGGSYGGKVLSGGYAKKEIVTATEMWFTVWMRTPASGDTAQVVFVKDGTAASFQVQVNSSGKLYIYNYADSSGVTGTHTFTANTWYKFKVYAKLADTGGSITAYYMDGSWTQDVNKTGDTLITSGGTSFLTGTSDPATGTRYIDEVNYYSSDPGAGM